jgi:hypothetical protein
LVLGAVAAGAGALVLVSGWATAAAVVGATAVGWGVYRRRVKRGTGREFFGESGEETRLTEIKPGEGDAKPPGQ